MNTNTGGPAFPTEYREDATQPCAEGMTLRDYFAAKAMQGYCSNQEHCTNCTIEMTADVAYAVADAMLEARK